LSGPEAGDWVKVYEARNHAEAGMVRGLLEGDDLLVMQRGRLGLPHLGSSEPVDMFVPEEQAVRARELIAAYLNAPLVEGSNR